MKHNPKAHETDRIIGMAWEDRTPFEAIEAQFGLSEGDVIDLMRHNLREKSFKRWRGRVSGRKTKHRKLRKDEVNRFVSPAQNPTTNNRISKKKYS
ncbi:MAG: TIGR03643 family protein [Rhodothermaceae bacterium]|nr:TIGR03643 family protein [Rhodothermaceae bacterium]